MKTKLLILNLILALSCTAFGATAVTKNTMSKTTWTIGSGGTLNVASGGVFNAASGSTFGVVPASTFTGLLTANGGIVCDVDKFAVANATGIITLGGGGTIDNNTSASVMNLTETTVRVTGIADVTGNSTLASVDVGGGSGGSGATITAAGAATFDGLVTATGGMTATGATTHNGAVTNNSTAVGPGGGSVVYQKYARITVATINAAAATGVPLLAAVAGRQYRIINAKIAAYGGAMTSTDAANLKIVSDPAGTPVVLYDVAKAQLAQATTAGVGINQMTPTTASTTILADNASFAAQVANKGISLITTTGGAYDWATATGVDVSITYTIE